MRGFTNSAMLQLGSVFVHRRRLQTEGVGVFMAYGPLGGFLLTWPLGGLSDRLDRRHVIIGAAVTAAVTNLMMVGVVPKQAPRWILYLCVAISVARLFRPTALSWLM